MKKYEKDIEKNSHTPERHSFDSTDRCLNVSHKNTWELSLESHIRTLTHLLFGNVDGFVLHNPRNRFGACR